MIFDTMRLGYNGNIMLGEAPLAVTNSYKYLGHIITDNLSDVMKQTSKIKKGVCTGDVGLMLYSEHSIFARKK